MAMRYLHADGWSWDDLEQVFECSSGTLESHLDGECDHPDLDEPMKYEPMAPTELRAKRRSAGLTQAEFGVLLDVSRGTVGSWERGDKTPRRHRWAQIRRALGGDST